MTPSEEDIRRELEKLMKDVPPFITEYPNSMCMIRTGNFVLFGKAESLHKAIEDHVSNQPSKDQ